MSVCLMGVCVCLFLISTLEKFLMFLCRVYYAGTITVLSCRQGHVCLYHLGSALCVIEWGMCVLLGMIGTVVDGMWFCWFYDYVINVFTVSLSPSVSPSSLSHSFLLLFSLSLSSLSLSSLFPSLFPSLYPFITTSHLSLASRWYQLLNHSLMFYQKCVDVLHYFAKHLREGTHFACV